MQFGHFDFDFVHDQNCGQEDVFYTTLRPLVHKLIEVCMLCLHSCFTVQACCSLVSFAEIRITAFTSTPLHLCWLA